MRFGEREREREERERERKREREIAKLKVLCYKNTYK